MIGRKTKKPEPEPVDLDELAEETTASILRAIDALSGRIKSSDTTAREARDASVAVINLTNAAIALHDRDEDDEDDEEGDDGEDE